MAEVQARRPKAFCLYNKTWEQTYAWLRTAVPGMALDKAAAKCMVCGSVFTVKWDGEAAVKKHEKSAKHKQMLKIRKETHVVGSVGAESSKVSAELADLCCGFRQHPCHMSVDCGMNIPCQTYTDSKMGCTRIKAEYDMTEELLTEMGDLFYSVASDAPNKWDRNTCPIAVQYFHPHKGVQRRLLGHYEDRNETADAITEKITSCLASKGLQLENLASYTAGDASVNYGKHHSVFLNLKSKVSHLLPSDCLCRVIHNCARHASKALDRLDVETLVIKMCGEFSSSAGRVHGLEEIFAFVDMEGTDLLQHVVTRWLSLLPAINRIVLCWPAVKSYFISKGPDECNAVIWKFFAEERDRCSDPNEVTEAECHLYFMQYVMEIFQKAIARLESSKLAATEVYGIMTTLENELQKRLEDSFFGYKVSVSLEKLSGSKKSSLLRDFNGFYMRAVAYLKGVFNHETSPLRAIQVLSLNQQAVYWPDLNHCLAALRVGHLLDTNDLYSDYVRLSQALPTLHSLSVEDKWVEFFRQATECKTLLKLVQFVLSIPASNTNTLLKSGRFLHG